jgi:hypothetical protein
MKTEKLVAFIFACLFAGYALIGCASTPKSPMNQKFDFYRAEMLISIGDRSYRGLAITPLPKPNTQLQVTIQSPITLDRLEISTCSRHVVMREVDKQGGWFGRSSSSYSMTYTYDPTPTELEGNCPIHFEAFSKDVQKAWGMLFFRDDQALPSEMDCNGQHWSFSGLSICQTKAGMEERMTFAVPVTFAATDNCIITTTDKLNYLVRSTGGFCKATFSDGTKFNDLVLLGYNQVVIY